MKITKYEFSTDESDASRWSAQMSSEIERQLYDDPIVDKESGEFVMLSMNVATGWSAIGIARPGQPPHLWLTAVRHERKRTAVVLGDGASDRVLKQVSDYLPSNYTASINDNYDILIEGHDHAGWTLDGYVIPRLQSGLINAVEVFEEN